MNASKTIHPDVRETANASVVSLMYHDIVPDGEIETSGFRGAAASKYKLDRLVFERHVEALRSTQKSAVDVFSVLKNPSRDVFVITFDDGGVSAIDAARILDRYGWRGHFLITTDLIGTEGFLSKDDIRSLARAGHLIGSHSCSHPRRMSACSPAQLANEWRDSMEVLRDLLGSDVYIASVPGGYSSREVVSAAAASGVKILFTSEPQTTTQEVNGCAVLGRFSIVRSSSADDAAALVTGTGVARWKQFAAWNSKKAIKKLTGDAYVDVRHWLLNRSSHS